MKKIVALALLLSFALSLFGCSGAGDQETTAPSVPETTVPAEPAVFMVGYSREDITPSVAVPLAGSGNTHLRTTDHVLDPLYVTCIAFQQGEETLLWFTFDLISTKQVAFAPIRARIVRRLGLTVDRVMFCCTHNHSGPDISSSAASIEIYKEELSAATLKAAENAIADLAPATLEGTRSKLEDMNCVRHYLMNDGTISGPHFGSTESGYKGYAAEKDNEMLLLKVNREGNKKDILVMNWQAHPCFTAGLTAKNISADFIGVTRTAIERDTDMLFAFFQGAQGNHNARSSIPNATIYKTNSTYGEQLAKEAISALPNLKPIEGTGIKSVSLRYEAAVNHDDEDMLEQAQEVHEMWATTANREVSNQLAYKYGFSSVYQASSIVARPNRPEKDTMELNAVYVGGLAFVAAPFEMFAATGMYIKENSPFAMTFICGNANESHSYVPTEEAFGYGSYESHISYFAKGTAEKVQVKFVEMLNELK